MTQTPDSVPIISEKKVLCQSRTAETGLDILDVNGRRVRRLVTRGLLEAGPHTVTWDGRDESGARSPAGVYFLRLVSGTDHVVQRVVSLGGTR